MVIPRCSGSWLVHGIQAFCFGSWGLKRVCRLEFPGSNCAKLPAWPAPSRSQCYKETAPGWMRAPDE